MAVASRASFGPRSKPAKAPACRARALVRPDDAAAGNRHLSVGCVFAAWVDHWSGRGPGRWLRPCNGPEVSVGGQVNQHAEAVAAQASPISRRIPLGSRWPPSSIDWKIEAASGLSRPVTCPSGHRGPQASHQGAIPGGGETLALGARIRIELSAGWARSNSRSSRRFQTRRFAAEENSRPSPAGSRRSRKTTSTMFAVRRLPAAF